MIVAVKNNNKKRTFIKILSTLVVIGMFVIYYNYMSNEFNEKNSDTSVEAVKVEEQDKKSKLERLVYREIETAVDLIGQRNVQKIKLVSNKVLIIADMDTNLDALKVRYGTMALIKKDIKDIKIAIDLQKVIESKLNE
jgi:hypothetical protein